METQLESNITRVECIFYSSNPAIRTRHDRRFDSTGKLGRMSMAPFWVHQCLSVRVWRTRLQELQATQERSKEGRHVALAMGQRPQRPCTFPSLAAHSTITTKAAHWADRPGWVRGLDVKNNNIYMLSSSPLQMLINRKWNINEKTETLTFTSIENVRWVSADRRLVFSVQTRFPVYMSHLQTLITELCKDSWPAELISFLCSNIPSSPSQLRFVL